MPRRILFGNTRRVLVTSLGTTLGIGAVALTAFFFPFQAALSSTPHPSLIRSEGGSENVLGRLPAGPVLDIKRGQSYLGIQSDSQLDPVDGRGFLVSIIVRFERLPDREVRQTVLSKVGETMNPSGWALGISHSPTALRPAVFWRDVYGRGGWFVFDRAELRPRVWYAITAVAQPGKFLDLFVEKLSIADALESSENGSGDISGAEGRGTQAIFAGGFPLIDVGIPSSDEELTAGALRQSRTSFRGQIAAVLIAWPSGFEQFQSFEEIRRFVQGGPYALAQKLDAAEINLWLNRGKDHGRYQRSVTLRGQATWEEAQQVEDAQQPSSS